MAVPYPHLFSPMEIRGRTLKNRIISAPNMLFQVWNGRPTDYYVGYLEHKAKGGAALVNLGEVPICDGATHTPFTKLTPDNLNIFGEMAAAIKQHGALASVELTHGGRNARPWYNTKPIRGPITEINPMGIFVQEMSRKDMEEVADAFADAAAYMADAGFDAVHIHGGHGWLFAQFISPLMNTRTDEFGSSLENRMRFPLMCLERIRRRVGDRILVTMRMSGSEREEGGFTPEDITEFVARSQEYIDLVEITTENFSYCMTSTYYPWGINVELADRIRNSGRVHIPVFVIGAIMSPEMAEEIIASGKADGVFLSRALIADPCMPNKAKTGRTDEIVPCLRCLRCTDQDNAVRFFTCSVNPTTAHETRLGFMEDILQVPAANRRRVLVAGGGPAGCSAALTAAARGHEVILCEAGNELGGMIRYAVFDPLKPDLHRYYDYLLHRVRKEAESGRIDLRMNTAVTPELADELHPDHILVATGSEAIPPTFIPGWERAHHVLDAYFRPETVEGEELVVIGGGLGGVEAALYLCDLGKKVTVLEKAACLTGVGYCYGRGVRDTIAKYGLPLVDGATVTEITPDAVRYTDNSGQEHLLKAESVFYAVGMKSRKDLYYQLWDKAPFVELIGDCRRPARIGEAVGDGHFAALDVGTW